jgi:DNA-binding response OmpR family regulator
MSNLSLSLGRNHTMKSKGNILIVSANVEQFAIVAFLLRNAGYDTITALDYYEGIKAALVDTPVLVIGELAMPGIDGLKLCCKIRMIERSSSTPIILVGDLSPTSAIVADGRRCGASYYMQKPFDPIRLFNRCTDLINAPADIRLDDDFERSCHAVLGSMALQA